MRVSSRAAQTARDLSIALRSHKIRATTFEPTASWIAKRVRVNFPLDREVGAPPMVAVPSARLGMTRILRSVRANFAGLLILSAADFSAYYPGPRSVLPSFQLDVLYEKIPRFIWPRGLDDPGDFSPRSLSGRAAARGSSQSARFERRSSLGALVLELPGGIEKRRLAQDDQRKSAG